MPFVDRIHAAADAGFTKIEFWPWQGKDIEEIASKAKQLEHITFFDDVIKQNFIFKKTVLGDMRNE